MAATDDTIRRLAIEQRGRLVAGLLREAESAMRPNVSAKDWQVFRQKVLDSVGQYHDFILDVLKVSREDHVRNERSLELLEAIHAEVKRRG